MRDRYYGVPLLSFEHYSHDTPSASDRPDAVVRAFGRRYTTYIAPIGTAVRVSRRGETLAHIAASEYGDAGLWWVLADYNPHIFDPAELAELTDVVIPDLVNTR